MPKTLYHGTGFDSIKSLEKGILLNKGNKKTDFGQGFYLTSNLKQAKGWALSRMRAVIENTGDNSNRAVIISYEIDFDLIKKLNYLFFTDAEVEWAEFVYANRVLDYNLHHNLHQDYDFVYGPLADGNPITLLVSKLRRKEINLNQFNEKIVGNKFPFPRDHQMSVHSEEAISALTFKEIMEVSRYAKQK